MVEQKLSRHGIGASEISAIAGLNPYASPWDIYLRKIGETADQQESPPMEWGIRLEPAIRQAYADKHQCSVIVPDTSMFHRDHSWARATPDGIVIDPEASTGPDAWRALVQCKNVGTWVEKAWRDAPPRYVQLQEQWEMFVTGLARADVAVLIGGNDFRVYTVYRDDSLITDLVEIAADFWNRVETKRPPEIDGSEACAAHFEKKLLARRGPIELIADENTEFLFQEWRKLRARMRDDESREAVIRNRVRAELAGAAAERLHSTIGTAVLMARGGTPRIDTDWKLIAELLGSVRSTADEWRSLVNANTKVKPSPVSLTLYAPREWSKESA